MESSSYFDLTDKDINIKNLYINRIDSFNCQLIDKDENVYDGFILAKSEAGKILTICDFHSSTTDQKYQARLIFHKTDKDFKDRNVSKGSDCVRIPFERGQEGYREFWKMISFLYKWREMIDIGEFEDYFSITEKNLADILPKIANIKNKKIVVNNLIKLSNNGLDDLSALVSIAKLVNILNEWEKNITNNNEEFWQKFFQNNSWIISQIFYCPYLKIGEKIYCGGKETDNKGGVLSDLFYQNKQTGNIALIEIKTPKDNIIIGQQYRGKKSGENVIYSMKEELTGSVNQVLNQKKVYTKTHDEKDGKTLNNTKCILIIGILPKEEDKKKSFELYRNSLRDVEIITYDELFDRIKSILTIFEN